MDTLPLFPLGTVLLPGASLPLHIFESRYRQLTADLVHEVVPDRRFGVVGIRQGWEVGADGLLAYQRESGLSTDEQEVDSMYDVGCSALLRDVRQLPEGRYDINGSGERRFRLLQVDREAAPYLMARVQWLPDTGPERDSRTVRERLISSARAAHERYHATGLRGRRCEGPPEHIGIEDLAYALAEDCVLSTEDRQALLSETDPLARLRLVRTVLLRETEFLRELRAVPAPLTEFAERASVN
jgi:uncharacterized protein